MIAPWTRDGRVLAEVVDIAPEVLGTITSVPVRDNQFVHKGDVLFELDPVRFRIAIPEAQAAVERARRQLRLRESDARRRQGLTGVVSAEEQEQYAINAAVALADLNAAQASLDLASLNFIRSVLHSPANGYVTNLRLRVGDYATVGERRVAVIDADSFWIYGYFEETQIRGINPGDPARIKLMGYRQPLTGRVESITRGINEPDSQIDRFGLPDVNPVFTLGSAGTADSGASRHRVRAARYPARQRHDLFGFGRRCRQPAGHTVRASACLVARLFVRSQVAVRPCAS